MSFCLDLLVIGQKYERTSLAGLWGYESYHAISRGVVTPSGTNFIILFVTENKCQDMTQYRDYIKDDLLHWEGEAKHGNDERIVHAVASGDRIYLFFRDEPRQPFIYYGEMDLVSYALKTEAPSSFVFRILSLIKRLFHCNSLKESDAYFESIISSVMLGDLEPGEGELEYLASLIAPELSKPFIYLQGSLSIAVFLVWMGCLYYKEGYYWCSVYQKLKLPQGQAKWQGILGECFLETIKEHQLLTVKGKLRYISPILAHGYISNSNLENYFEDVLLPVCKDREQKGSKMGKGEVEYIVSTWCQDYEGYKTCKGLISQLELEETSLNNSIEALKNKETLEKLRELQAKLKGSAEMQELLSLPEDWLSNAESKLVAYQEKYSVLKNQLEQQWKIDEARESKVIAINKLTENMEAAASQIFESWENSLSGRVIALPVNEIKKLSKDVVTAKKIFTGVRGWFLRIFVPSSYKKSCRDKQRLGNLLGPLPVRQKLLSEPWPELPKYLNILQEVVKQFNEAVETLARLDSAPQEIAATQKNLFVVNIDKVGDGLTKLIQEIAAYKTNLVKLGKGRLEDGIDELKEQRKLRGEIAEIQAQIPGDVSILLSILTVIGNDQEIKEIENQLVRIRKQKKDTLEKLRVYKNPLYSLNEPARVFIFEGGDIAVEFIYNSLMFITKLYKGETSWEGRLPQRITRAMSQWWDQRGKELLEQIWEKQILEGKRETDSVPMRRPSVHFDAMNREIKIVLPAQPVNRQAEARFVIRDGSGQERVVLVPIQVEDNVYRSVAAEVLLESPEQIYDVEFCCIETIKRWQIPGISWDNFCMLFNRHGELVENGQLPDGGAYIIVPFNSSVEPAAIIQERLPGRWADYEYCYIDLKNVDVVSVNAGKDVVVFKRLVQFQPTFISSNVLTGIKAGEAIICQGQLPNLLFSVTLPAEVAFYGVQLENAGEVEFRSMEQLTPAISKNNVVHLPLADLNKAKYGLFTVTLFKRGMPAWFALCAVVPDLELTFDKQFYRLQDETREKGQLEFISKHEIEFYPEEINNIDFRRLSSTQVEFDTRLNFVRGKLTYCIAGKIFSFDVCVDVPCIRWCQSDGEWCARAEEIWHGDLGEIEIKIPGKAGDSVKVALNGNKQVFTRPVQKGVAVFDLRRFSDTLRDSGQAVQELVLIFPQTPPFLLARVRIRWQALKIKLTQHLQGGDRQLLLEWEDRGKSVGRVVRFWPLDMPDTGVLEWEIPDGVGNINITVPLVSMPPGRYRLNLAETDLWGNDKGEMPEEGTENCKDVNIGTADEQLQAYVGKQLEITGFYYKGELVKPETFYWVEVRALEPRFEGEVLLAGNVYSRTADGTIVEMPYNPVNFYISTSKMPFLIDRDEDGATYCRKCGVMFWEVGHKKCGEAVIEPELIDYRVRG